jgi:hypothetical protein
VAERVGFEPTAGRADGLPFHDPLSPLSVNELFSKRWTCETSRYGEVTIGCRPLCVCCRRHVDRYDRPVSRLALHAAEKDSRSRFEGPSR